jgi:hypothetical protein
MKQLLFAVFFIGFIAINGCKKESNNTNSNNTTNSTPTQAMFYTTQDCGVGNISVTINGTTKVISSYYASVPSCGASGTATFDLSAGNYSFTASAANNTTWSGDVTVVANSCNSFHLDCGNSGNTLPTNYSNQGVITVHSQNLQICARDFSVIDGDKIDLVINGTTYLTDYTISGTDRCFNVTLPKGNNWIGIIAKDEGSIPPCTPGITINDGISSQDFEIRSNVGGTNGAYIINVSL